MLTQSDDIFGLTLYFVSVLFSLFSNSFNSKSKFLELLLWYWASLVFSIFVIALLVLLLAYLVLTYFKTSTYLSEDNFYFFCLFKLTSSFFWDIVYIFLLVRISFFFLLYKYIYQSAKVLVIVANFKLRSAYWTEISSFLKIKVRHSKNP